MTDFCNSLIKFTLIAVLLVSATGCDLAMEPLSGTRWRLVGWIISSLSPTEFRISAEFYEGMISGNSGVNSYSGSYKFGLGNAFSVEEIMSTMMAGPENTMRAEAAYLDLLTDVSTYQLTEGRLTLFDSTGNELLIFEMEDIRK